jgi:hypothetical protein
VSSSVPNLIALIMNMKERSSWTIVSMGVG